MDRISKVDCQKCKAYGHAWEPSSPHPLFDKLWDKALHSDCIRCGSSKVDDLDAYGRPAHTQYYYSDAYRKFLDTAPERATCRNIVFKANRKATRRLQAVPA